MHEKWAISDTHLFHANILKFTMEGGLRIRPFDNLEQMHNLMINQWNSVVSVNDYVYHLGDVTFKYDKAFNELMSQLKGRKRLILGNHDKIKGTNLMDWFEKVELWKGFKEHAFTMSHMPLREGSFRDGKVNIHGHTHQNIVKGPYINVCVETRDYRPVHFDELIKETQAIIKDLENIDKINKNLNR